jgi:hypothetical protein
VIFMLIVPLPLAPFPDTPGGGILHGAQQDLS